MLRQKQTLRIFTAPTTSTRHVWAKDHSERCIRERTSQTSRSSWLLRPLISRNCPNRRLRRFMMRSSSSSSATTLTLSTTTRHTKTISLFTYAWNCARVVSSSSLSLIRRKSSRRRRLPRLPRVFWELLITFTPRKSSTVTSNLRTLCLIKRVAQ